MRLTDNYCVGCEVCMHCGRRNVLHYVCDSCYADTLDGETKMYGDNGKHYCYKCIIKNNESEFLSDMIDEHGEDWVHENFDEVGDD